MRWWSLLLLVVGGMATAAEGWQSGGKAGIFGTSILSSGERDSRDPAIRGTTDTSALQVRFEGGLDWRGDSRSCDQSLLLYYGTVHQRATGWQENADEIRYDGVARQTLREPQFLYVGWGVDTVFNGPEPRQAAFDPTLSRAGLGYGLLFEGLLPVRDQLEFRIGARTQRRWGPSLGADQRGIESGPEAYLHYDRTVDERLSFKAQYELFSEFADLGHVTQLATAGLDLALARHLTLAVALRAYNETRPKDDPERPGYHVWSLRQETLLGLTYAW